MGVYLLDTNVILEIDEDLMKHFEYDVVCVCNTSLDELENIKTKRFYTDEQKYKARNAVRFLYENNRLFSFVDDISNRDKPDDRIIETALYLKATLVTNDKVMFLRAKEIFGCPVEEYIPKKEVYLGYRWINQGDPIPDDLLVNQYLLILDEEDTIVEQYRQTEEGLVEVVDKHYKSYMLGETYPLDFSQKLAIDSIENNQLTLLTGQQGCGKSFLALSHAIEGLERHQYEKIVYVVNPTKAKYAEDIGFYKGSMMDKLLQGNIGNILGSKLGEDLVTQLIAQDRLQILIVADIRGWQAPPYSCVIVEESQNLNVELLKLIIGRIADDTKVIFDGDWLRQTDSHAYDGHQNALRALVRSFKGNHLFGCVDLAEVHRSELASLAESIH